MQWRCIRAPLYDNQGNKVNNKKCTFCRAPFPAFNEDTVKQVKKRAKMNDPIAVFNMGHNYYHGLQGFTQDYTQALELWHRAAELGYMRAYSNIGLAYDEGGGVEIDIKKAKHYYELAATGGDVCARHNLGNKEALAGNFDRAIKHYMIASRSGSSESLNIIKDFYVGGDATKEDYTKALQLYQSYLSEIKSSQRDEAAQFDIERYRYY